MGQPAVAEEPIPPRVPVVFGSRERPLTGIYHAPAGRSARSLSVVLCNPLGYEAMSVHRSYRHLAERLAASGFATLRFDYDGAGDSPAPSTDPARLAAWVGSIRAATSELRGWSGSDRIALVGVGFGATLAMVAATEQADLDSLILWAPVVSGQAHTRELRAFRLFKYSKAGPPPRSDGSEEIAGYVFSRETLGEMAAIDLLGGRARPARRVLVMTRSDKSTDEAHLVAHLKACGSEAELASASGYAGMMRDDPYDTVPPAAALEAMVAWLAAGNPLDRATPPSSPPVPSAVSLARDGELLARETALTFGERNRLFGILTEPIKPAPADRPAVIFLNVGANHHVGPHRMNVELAREVAGLGYPAFRFDASGLGESGVVPGEAENRIYTKDAVADVEAAMQLLNRSCGASRFILVGLCSGAYLAFHSAVDDPRIAGQVLLSPYAFEWHEGDPVKPLQRKAIQGFRSTRFYARAAFDPRAWLLVLQGKVDVRGVAGAILERAQERFEAVLPSLSAGFRRQQRPQTEIELSFRDLCDRGVETLMVLAFEDGGLDMIARYLGRDARRMRGRKNFRLEILKNVDHTFTTVDSQQRLRRILTEYLGTRFG